MSTKFDDYDEEAIQKAIENHSDKKHRGNVLGWSASCCKQVCLDLLESGEWVSVAELRKEIQPHFENASRHVALYAEDLTPSGTSHYQYWEGVMFAFNSVLATIELLLPKPLEAKKQ